jgi:hypothetical protein
MTHEIKIKILIKADHIQSAMYQKKSPGKPKTIQYPVDLEAERIIKD